MTIQSLEAVFENGVFRPITQPAQPLVEGQRVRLTMELPEPEETLRLATDVFTGLSVEQMNTIEQIILDRSRFFDDRPQQ